MLVPKLEHRSSGVFQEAIGSVTQNCLNWRTRCFGYLLIFRECISSGGMFSLVQSKYCTSCWEEEMQQFRLSGGLISSSAWGPSAGCRLCKSVYPFGRTVSLRISELISSLSLCVIFSILGMVGFELMIFWAVTASRPRAAVWGETEKLVKHWWHPVVSGVSYLDVWTLMTKLGQSS